MQCLAILMGSIALLLTHFAVGAEPNKIVNIVDSSNQKVYLSVNDLIFHDNCLYVIEEGGMLKVNKIEQDDLGMYYYRSWVYGFCPRGHAYGPDGKCNGDDCLFS